MKRSDYFFLFLINLILFLIVASIQDVPGYMDADYYYAGGLNLAKGEGFQDNFLWNYLDDPVSLPHPSYTYWMPLPSIISALGMFLTGKTDYQSARWIFLILASLIPPLTARFGYHFSRQRISAWIAGGLATFSGFYLVYMGLAETFALTMLLGSAWLWIANNSTQPLKKFFALGAISGLLHLTRADGIVWLLFSIILVIVFPNKRTNNKLRSLFGLTCVVIIGYIMIVGFWYARNYVEFGALFPPGSSRALWIFEYDQMFSFPATKITANNYLGYGIAGLLSQRWEALLANLQTSLAVEGQIFLVPLLILGWLKRRKDLLVRLGTIIWLWIFLLMTLVFPLAGSRGGFLHSVAALQPLAWGLCPVGLGVLIEWGIRKRNWKMERALPGFGLMLVFIAAAISSALFWVRVIGYPSPSNLWHQPWDSYQAMENVIVRAGAQTDDIVMVNNPPGYFVVSGRRAIVIPDGDLNVTLDAAKVFGADYLILDKNTVKGLSTLYSLPDDRPGLDYMLSFQGFHLFEFVP